MHGELAGSSLFTSRLVFPDFAARSRCTPFPAVRDEIKREDRRHEHRKDAVRETTAAAVLSNIDVERGPSIQRERLSTLPEHWDTNTLEQDFKEHTSHIRNRALRRRTPRRLARRQGAGGNVVDSRQWGLKRGSYLKRNEQEFLADKYNRWQQAKRVFDQLTSDNGRQPSSEEWANSCQVSESELRQSLSDGPKAADLILASVEHLLRSLCYRYLKSQWDVEDVYLEAQNLWLEAVTNFQPEKASLTSFGVMFVRQRLGLRMDGMNDTMSRSPQLVKDEYIVLRVKTDFKEEQGREPTVQELARLAKKPVHRVKYILSGMRALVSFDSASSTGNGSGGQIEGPETVGDTIEEENNIGEHEDVNLLPGLRTELAVKFHQTINKVVKDPQDKDMLFMHYRLLDSEDAPSSFKDLGRRFGMSYESVRLRLKRIKEEIRQSPKLTAELKQYFTAEVLDY